MRKIYLFAAAAAMLAACSSDKLEAPAPPQPELKEIAVGFDAYTQRGVTRAGVSGTLTDTNFKDGTSAISLAGFGVFGYYTDLNEYDQLYTPDFMYNQQVKYNTATSSWEYSPVKYWPNEYGNSAISDDVDKVSFFAYAPYVAVTPASGKVDAAENTWGIAGITKNSATGDPIVKYITSFDQAKTVDLCWGVANGEVWNKTNGGSQVMTAGMPWLNVERPADYTGASPLKFTFMHALTQLEVKIDAAVDELTPGTNNLDATETKIFVRSISFTGISAKGALNLNNTNANEALWLNFNGTDELDSGDEVIVYDGLKDGKEGTGQVATNEKSLGLNPVIISDNGNTQAGVTNTPVDLLANGTAFVIPSGEPMTVTITYDVETRDDNLAGYLSDGSTHGSSIQNVISKEVTFDADPDQNHLKNGKKYILNLHLGMNSVKFDADVAEWDPTAIERNVDLPSNLAHFVAGAPGTNSTVNLPYDLTSYSYIIDGLDASTAVTWTPAVPVADGGSDATATASGQAVAKLTITANNTPWNVATGSMKAETATTPKELTLNIIQAYHPLGLTYTAVAATDNEIVLGTDALTGATVAWATDVLNPATDIEVTLNGTPLVYSATPAAANEFGWDTSGANPKITLVTPANNLDIYIVKVKAGDAPAETKTINVP